MSETKFSTTIVQPLGFYIFILDAVWKKLKLQVNWLLQATTSVEIPPVSDTFFFNQFPSVCTILLLICLFFLSSYIHVSAENDNRCTSKHTGIIAIGILGCFASVGND